MKPGKASGTFPRQDDSRFADSAVYLEARVGSKPARQIRIPVRGTATDG